jgi:hypothetical protein
MLYPLSYEGEGWRIALRRLGPGRLTVWPRTCCVRHRGLSPIVVAVVDVAPDNYSAWQKGQILDGWDSATGVGVMGIEDQTVEESRGLDRRTLIKRAAAAGAVAWTAPVVITSMTSPAAAATCECAGILYVQINDDGGPGNCLDTNNQYQTDLATHPCQPDSSGVGSCGSCGQSGGQNTADFCIDSTTLGCQGQVPVTVFKIKTNCTTVPDPDAINPVPGPFTNCRFLSGVGQEEDGEARCITGARSESNHTITFDASALTDFHGWTEWRMILCCDDAPT